MPKNAAVMVKLYNFYYPVVYLDSLDNSIIQYFIFPQMIFGWYENGSAVGAIFILPGDPWVMRVFRDPKLF